MFNAEQYWEERLRERYDLVGVGDISLSETYNKWSYKVTRKVLLRLLKKYSSGKTNQRVLDIGSGTGFVVNIWKSLGKKVTGLDISTTAVEKLKQNNPEAAFYQCDIGKASVPIDDNSFSMCSAASVLYHIVEDEALLTALKNIHRLLEKDGIFIFSENFIHRRTFAITHQKGRSLEEYTAALQQTGFEILDRLPNYVLMNDPVDAQGKFYPRIWSVLTRLSGKSKILDNIIWPAVYPFELFLTSVMKESPAQEFMICKAVK